MIWGPFGSSGIESVPLQEEPWSSTAARPLRLLTTFLVRLVGRKKRQPGTHTNSEDLLSQPTDTQPRAYRLQFPKVSYCGETKGHLIL